MLKYNWMHDLKQIYSLLLHSALLTLRNIIGPSSDECSMYCTVTTLTLDVSFHS